MLGASLWNSEEGLQRDKAGGRKRLMRDPKSRVHRTRWIRQNEERKEPKVSPGVVGLRVGVGPFTKWGERKAQQWG